MSTKYKKSKADFVSFPANLKYLPEVYTNCLHFTCLNPVVKGGGALATSYRGNRLQFSRVGNKINHLLDIYMYKPNLVQKLNHSYETVTPGMIDSIVGSIRNMESSGNQGGSETQSHSKPEIGFNVDTLVAGAKGFAKKISSVFEKKVMELYSVDQVQRRGQSLITPAADTYKGTETRKQTFTFKMNPRNKDDLSSMAKIIYYFHYFSLPTYAGTNIGGFDATSLKTTDGTGWYNVPKMWYIEEMFGVSMRKDATAAGSQRHTPKFLFGPAVITSVEYNSTPDQYSKTLKGTAADPSTVELVVSFSEVTPLDASLYDSQNRNTSVHGIGPAVYKK